MNLIPARNARLPGSAAEARSVIAHHTEKISVSVPNRPDDSATNVRDPKVKGGLLNVWLTEKPYLGQNSSIYVMLLDVAGEMSGAPLQINLNNDATHGDRSYIAKWGPEEGFIAFDPKGQPMSLADYPAPTDANTNAVFDDQVKYYCDLATAQANWVTDWGDIADFTRNTPTEYGTAYGANAYNYLIAPAGGTAQPKCFKEGSTFVYKVNVPSILEGDIVLLDYYVEHRHDAVQVSILPDKFAGYYYVEGESLIRRASDGVDLPVKFVIPKFKVTTALTFTLQSTGDPSTFNFQGDAYPDYSKFDLTQKVFADVQIIGADDNYDGGDTGLVGDPTSYRRFRYNEDTEGEYLWKDPSMPAHQNIDYSDTGDYVPTHGGPATITPGAGLIG